MDDPCLEQGPARGLLRCDALLQLPLLTLCAFILITPNLALLPLFPYDEKRLLALLLLTLTALTLLAAPRAASAALATVPRTGRRLLALVALLGLLSAALSASPRHALLEVGWFTLLLLLALALAAARRRLGPVFDHWVVAALAASAALYLVAFAAGYLAAALGTLPLRPRDLFGNFANIRFFGQFLSWSLPLIVLALPLARPRHRPPLLLLAAGWWMLLWVSGTRGAMAGLLAALLAVLLAGGRRSAWLRWQGMAAAAGALLYGVLLYLLPPLLGLDAAGIAGDMLSRDPFAAAGRGPVFAHAWQLVLAAPWLGAGPMHFACNPPLPVAHPHNAPLQIAAEWGIPAALAVGLLTLWGLAGLFRAARRQVAAKGSSAELHLALLAALVAAAVHALVSGIVVMPLSQMMLALVAGWAVGLVAHAPSEPSPRPRVIQLAAAAGLALVVAGVWPDLARSIQRGPVVEAAELKPRFWQRGVICRPEPAPVRKTGSAN